jgi:hypothetical protein
MLNDQFGDSAVHSRIINCYQQLGVSPEDQQRQPSSRDSVYAIA